MFRNVYFTYSGSDNDFHTIKLAPRMYRHANPSLHCRLQTKIEDLEHLMNDEVTDINEAIRTINNLQVSLWFLSKITAH